MSLPVRSIFPSSPSKPLADHRTTFVVSNLSQQRVLAPCLSKRHGTQSLLLVCVLLTTWDWQIKPVSFFGAHPGSSTASLANARKSAAGCLPSHRLGIRLPSDSNNLPEACAGWSSPSSRCLEQSLPLPRKYTQQAKEKALTTHLFVASFASKKPTNTATEATEEARIFFVEAEPKMRALRRNIISEDSVLVDGETLLLFFPSAHVCRKREQLRISYQSVCFQSRSPRIALSSKLRHFTAVKKMTTYISCHFFFDDGAFLFVGNSMLMFLQGHGSMLNVR